MTKWIVMLFFTFITGTAVFGQLPELEIKGVGSDLYLNHKVEAKENFYSIGRMYNVSPKELAGYNKLQLESGLSVGQDIRIPLDKNNFTQSETKSVLDFLIPVRHTVAGGETLYRLGVNYNKVPAASIKKWNGLSSDAVSEGTPLIVGFLKVDKNQSSLAKASPTGTPVASPGATVAVEEKKEPEKVSVITQTKPKDDVVQQVTNTDTAQPASAETVMQAGNTDGNEGLFKPLFDQQSLAGQVTTGGGTAGIFKSTSGWQDGKYYCFNNQAAPGSILKVTNTATGRTVYAKVLDAIPDIKQNAGLVVIVSNAAGDALGTGETKFECVLGYVR